MEATSTLTPGNHVPCSVPCVCIPWSAWACDIVSLRPGWCRSELDFMICYVHLVAMRARGHHILLAPKHHPSVARNKAARRRLAQRVVVFPRWIGQNTSRRLGSSWGIGDIGLVLGWSEVWGSYHDRLDGSDRHGPGWCWFGREAQAAELHRLFASSGRAKGARLPLGSFFWSSRSQSFPLQLGQVGSFALAWLIPTSLL